MRVEHWRYILPLRLRSLLRREQVEQELDEELRDHLDRKIEAYIADGLTPEQARFPSSTSIASNDGYFRRLRRTIGRRVE
jgi:hypothetical protein